MKFLRGFDPILFLELRNINSKDRNKLSFELMSQISEFLVIKTLQIVPEEKAEEINSLEELFEYASENISQYDQKVKTFLNEFKTEFQQKFK